MAVTLITTGELFIEKRGLPSLVLAFLHFLFFLLSNDSLFLDIDSQKRVQAHVDVSNPHQCEASKKITAPVVKQQCEFGDDEHEDGNVVTEAILAGEEIKEFSDSNRFRVLALFNTILAWLTKNFLVRHSPGDAGDGNSENEKPEQLGIEFHDW